MRDLTSPPLATSPSRSWLSPRTVLLVLVALRLFNALTIRTFFQPDEYFQALEPAWLMAFGHDSSPWMTWEWKMRLRSSLHPRFFTIAYIAADYVASAVELSPPVRSHILIAIPKVVQAILAAFGDWYTWRLSQEIHGGKQLIAETTLLMTVLSPWQWYVSTRTFSNSMETVLTVMALYYWPWRLFADAKQEKAAPLTIPGELTGLRVSLILAATAVLLRPTNVLVWFSIGTILLTRLTLEGHSPISVSVLVVLLREAILCGSAVLAVSAVSDNLFYDEWVFPPYKFLYFNLAQSLAVFYGQNDWHYYLSQGIPLLSFGALPFVLCGLWKALRPMTEAGMTVWTGNVLRTLGFAAVTVMGALSMISHKEVRFIYPLLPIFHLLAAPYAASYFTKPAMGKLPNKPISFTKAVVLKRKSVLTAILAINLVVGGYLSYLHAAAPMAVLDFLRHEWEVRHPDALSLGRDMVSPVTLVPSSSQCDYFVVFLVPCHTSPWRSHLVYSELTGRALSCSPPLETLPGSDERKNYQSETDMFYANITDFLGRQANEEWSLNWGTDKIHTTMKEGGVHLPEFIVGFSGIADELLGYFESGDGKGWNVKLQQRWAMWNGLFSDDWKREGSLIVWEVAQEQAEHQAE